MLLDDYTLTKLLGSGTFGDVYLTTRKDNNVKYATKRMDRELAEHPQYCKYFVNEVSILRSIYHKNIVKIEDLKKTKNHYYIIMEYCNGGSLAKNLEKYLEIYKKPFSEKIVQHIMRQIVSAVNYLHELKIVHRDLKLDNILINYESEIDKNQINLLKSEIKIVDFGFATHMTSAKLLTSAIGSPFNMDPRILKKFTSRKNNLQRYDEKVDIWSLGTLCYKMLTGENAFYAESVQELASKVEEGTFKVPIIFARETISFLLGMLQYDSSQRLSAKELMNHPFLMKNVEDFSYIDLRQVAHKMKYDDLYINIKENQTITSLVNVVNKEGEKQFNIMPKDLFPIETGSLYLFNNNEPNQIRPKEQKENKDINSQLTYNTYSGINNMTDFSNNNEISLKSFKYGLDSAEMVNSTILSPSFAMNLKNMENKDPVIGELLEMKMPQEQKVLLNSLIHINYFPSQIWKSAPQPEDQIYQNNNLGVQSKFNQMNNYQTIHSKVNTNIYQPVLNPKPTIIPISTKYMHRSPVKTTTAIKYQVYQGYNTAIKRNRSENNFIQNFGANQINNNNIPRIINPPPYQITTNKNNYGMFRQYNVKTNISKNNIQVISKPNISLNKQIKRVKQPIYKATSSTNLISGVNNNNFNAFNPQNFFTPKKYHQI